MTGEFGGKGTHRRCSAAAVLALAALVLASLTGCSALDPQLRLDVQSGGEGHFSFEMLSGGGLSDLPVRAALDQIRQQLGAAGIRGEVATFQRKGSTWLTLRLPFKTQEELRRITGAQIRIPDSVRVVLPPPVALVLPEHFALTDVQLVMDQGWLGSKTFIFGASLDIALATAMEASGLSVHLSLPGRISDANGRIEEDDVIWPGPNGWPRRLEARSHLGIFGIKWGWAGAILLALGGLCAIGVAGWLVVHWTKGRRPVRVPRPPVLRRAKRYKA